MDEESTAGRGAGGRTTSGMRSGGRGPVAADGSGGRTGGSTGAGRDEKTSKRKSMVFEDDDAWGDDDEAGPGVIR
jgi:hypothetical protein